ncbi:MAG: ATP-binding cassette domain-containing protein [Pseudomonadota bacterium]
MTGMALKVRDLVVKGDQGRDLLSVANFDASPGEVVVVRGPSGAGKSTLLFALAGLIKPQTGSIRWGETDLVGMSDHARTAFRRTAIGFTFQDHLLFDELGAVGNASLAGAFAPRRNRSNHKAQATALLHHLKVSPEQRSVASYSGGERQRIAVARAMAADPPVILADEPTANLDREAANHLIDDLMALADRNRTVIIVSHDAALHARATRLASVIDGKVRVAARV